MNRSPSRLAAPEAPAPVPRAPSAAARALRVLLLLYRGATAHRSPACRFTPSCSQYALEALEAFGALRAAPLVLRRLVRCRPGGPFGYDPVPEPTAGARPKSRRP